MEYKTCCTNCRFFFEDAPVNYAECMNEAWTPEEEDQLDKIFENNGEDCPRFELNQAVVELDQLLAEINSEE